ncbi:acyl carrier protein [Sedimenticola hydrogenitrophicus]|uniref:acyl carrier protein n=1 Tax=Sedimenticola hydrogenitrophicus TaxID=2967975 RepID=UPI0021A6FEFA|nr:acyl carrier protein [Sedimenticola hydrogenitrophicus]
MNTEESVIHVVCEVLQIPERVSNMNQSTELLGAIPEFDSMAVVSIITGLEDAFDIFIEDDEIDASMFETVGTLTKFMDQKLV